MKKKNRFWLKSLTMVGLLLIFTFALKTNAQNYQISFAGTGAATTVDSVKIENTTQGTKLSIHGTDVLNLKVITGIKEQDENSEMVIINPTPMQGRAELIFYAKQSGNTNIVIFDISGKKIIQTNNKLVQGFHRYEIAGITEGSYMVNIIADNYQYNVKLISNSSISNNASIKYIGLGNNIAFQYKLNGALSTVNMNYKTGDNLRFTGYSGIYTAIVNDVPKASKTITFTFAALATISTTSVSAITANSATSGGNITSDGGAVITARGVCWGISQNPTISDNHTSDGTGTGNFVSNITGLSLSIKYYVRAYATNSAGTSYGTQVDFTTIIPPTITTTAISAIHADSATSGGNITSDGGSPIIARGICWSRLSNPTLIDSFTKDGTGTGSFVSIISGLSFNTKYYVCAYATNVAGTSYGSVLSFTTSSVLPVLTTKAMSAINVDSAYTGGIITSYGGASITARGVCWGHSLNPSLSSDSFTKDGTGMGSFTSIITGLNPYTLYHVRAYATNSYGTAYGNDATFTTANIAIGQIYHGGKIAYILQPGDSGYIAGLIKGFIAAPTDQSTGIQWSSSFINTGLGARSELLGKGKANTDSIIAHHGAGNYAARLCYDLVLNGYDDWYLPSTEELNKLYLNRVAIGGFTTVSTDPYWSSSEYHPYNETKAEVQFFNNGYIYFHNKTFLHPVRAIRSFGPVVYIPSLTTTAITSITQTTATSGGNIISDGGANISVRGVCWSTSTNPTISGNKTTDGTGNGSFTSSITGLIPNTLYYVRAYATNLMGTGYGNQVIFTTSPTIPVINTTNITSITQTTATSGGNITSDGGAIVTKRGVCWSTNPSPTISDSLTNDGTGSGSFSSALTGLTLDTKYYLRAYAINSAGTSYGNVLTFITEQATTNTVKDFDGNIYDTIHIGTQIWLKQNLKTLHYSNGDAIPTETLVANKYCALKTGAYVNYNNSTSFGSTYGRLYNFYAVADPRYLCPAGWHVPSDNEWTTLINYLGGANVAGGRLKETGTSHWYTPNFGATDSSHFTALPGGYIAQTVNCSFFSLNFYGYWWSSTESNTYNAWFRSMNNQDKIVTRDKYSKSNGNSVRCIKN